MDITEKIRSHIREAHENDFSEEETQALMNKILGLGAWEEIRNGLLAILYDDDQALWNQTIIYIYYFQGRGYTYEDAITIAIMNNCLTLSDDLDENLIWTITKNIKSISYLSDYDPYHDPAVLSEMNRIREKRSRP